MVLVVVLVDVVVDVDPSLHRTVYVSHVLLGTRLGAGHGQLGAQGSMILVQVLPPGEFQVQDWRHGSGVVQQHGW